MSGGGADVPIQHGVLLRGRTICCCGVVVGGVCSVHLCVSLQPVPLTEGTRTVVKCHLLRVGAWVALTDDHFLWLHAATNFKVTGIMNFDGTK